jgi:alanyl aminopeptidase
MFLSRMPLPHVRVARLLLAIALVCCVRAAEVQDPLRLSREVVPVAQAVELTLDPSRDDYTGSVRIDVLVQRAVTSFRLHALGPAFSSAKLRSPAGAETTLTAAVTDAKEGLVTLTAPAPLVPGAYILRIEFANRYARDGLGLYKTVSRGDAYLFTQFEAVSARRAFPCWDEPSFKIPWQVTLTVPDGTEAVANAPAAQETRGKGTRTIAFGRTPPMPSYLVALAAGPLEYVPIPGLTVPGRIITPRGQSALAAEAARLAPVLLQGLEEYFAIPYPFAKLDLVAVPEFTYGAMENAGLITFRDGTLLIAPERVSFAARRGAARVIAHEMAHMWFGDLVTMAWWDDLWLNESFATWLEEKTVHRLYPEMRENLNAVTTANNALSADGRPSVPTMRREFRAGDDFLASSTLTYNKGKAILNMVEGWIGPDKFRAAMQAYMRKHRWENTTAADLWAAFDSASGENISGLIAGFVGQPGVPLVTFSILPDGRLQLRQERFRTLAGPPATGLWPIPVTFTWAENGRVHRERVLLREPAQVVNLPGLSGADWLYPNTGESGYYRWSLSTELNSRLARHAATVLSPAERIGLLNNLAAIFGAGTISGGDYLATLAGFAGDPEPEVTQRAITGITSIREPFVRAPQLPAYLGLRDALLRPALDRIGLQANGNEPDYVAPLRNALLSALGREGGLPVIVDLARSRAQDFLRDPQSVEAGMLGTVLNLAAYHGDAALFTSLTQALETAPTPAARNAIIAALGNFNDPAIARQALAFALTPALNSTQFMTVANAVAGNPALRPLAVDWFMANYPAIAAKGSERVTGAGISLAGSDPEQFQRLRTFLEDPSRRSSMGDSNIVIAADGVAQRRKIQETQTESILAYLSAQAARRR